MNFFYRHRVLFGFAALALSVAFTFAVCFMALSRTVAGARRLTVVIDAGHGGIDGGVVGVETGKKESDLNLALSRKLQTVFEDAGFLVVQTRPTEEGLYGMATAGYKKRDMRARAQVIEETAPAIVLSIHQNFFSLRSRRGAQVFYRADSASSKSLALLVQEELNNMPECVKRADALIGDYYVLNCSDYPSVIVECGFLSNAEDERLLVTDEYQQKIAEAILRGALQYFTRSDENFS